MPEHTEEALSIIQEGPFSGYEIGAILYLEKTGGTRFQEIPQQGTLTPPTGLLRLIVQLHTDERGEIYVEVLRSIYRQGELIIVEPTASFYRVIPGSTKDSTTRFVKLNAHIASPENPELLGNGPLQQYSVGTILQIRSGLFTILGSTQVVKDDQIESAQYPLITSPKCYKNNTARAIEIQKLQGQPNIKALQILRTCREKRGKVVLSVEETPIIIVPTTIIGFGQGKIKFEFTPLTCKIVL